MNKDMKPAAVASAGTVATDRPDAIRPLALPVALWRILRCVAVTVILLARGRLHQPVTKVGERLTFGDGTSAPVYRETVVDRAPLSEPTVLVVTFRMRLLNGRRGQAYFRLISLLNTVLFAGFPGFATKLWLTADQQGKYRGLYEWDGSRRADDYVRALWWPLMAISQRSSIRYRMLPGRRRDELLADSEPTSTRLDDGWWKVTTAPALS